MPVHATAPARQATAGAPGILRNADVDWSRWPVQDYVAENYAWLHPADAAVIDHHAAAIGRLSPASVSRSVELGAGPNLYPLMIAAAASRRIDAVEPSLTNVSYLRRQLHGAPDAHWQPFYARCRTRLPHLPATLSAALSRVRVIRGGAAAIPAGRYGLASMNFVAESVTADVEEFAALCRTFVRVVGPGGLLIAAFMEGMRAYTIGARSSWPGVPVDADCLRRTFAPWTAGLRITRLEVDPTLPDYGSTGMLLLTARRAR